MSQLLYFVKTSVKEILSKEHRILKVQNPAESLCHPRPWEPNKDCKRKSMRGNSKVIERRQLYLVTRAWETGYPQPRPSLGVS